MRIFAVDYGRRRIGLAVCDALGITVRGLDTVVRRGTAEEAAASVALEVRNAGGVERLVVGLPLHADGHESEMSAEARAFGETLARATGLPVEFYDESLTSWEAEESLKGRKKSLERARREGDVDRAAAVAILRSFLRDRGG